MAWLTIRISLKKRVKLSYLAPCCATHYNSLPVKNETSKEVIPNVLRGEKGPHLTAIHPPVVILILSCQNSITVKENK